MFIPTPQISLNHLLPMSCALVPPTQLGERILEDGLIGTRQARRVALVPVLVLVLSLVRVGRIACRRSTWNSTAKVHRPIALALLVLLIRITHRRTILPITIASRCR